MVTCVPVVQLVEADKAWLKRSESHHRAIKMSLVQQHRPDLIRQFEQQQRDKAEKKTQAGRKKATSKVSILLPIGHDFLWQPTHPQILSKPPAHT